jgi:hypothetical protein
VVIRQRPASAAQIPLDRADGEGITRGAEAAPGSLRGSRQFELAVVGELDADAHDRPGKDGIRRRGGEDGAFALERLVAVASRNREGHIDRARPEVFADNGASVGVRGQERV